MLHLSALSLLRSGRAPSALSLARSGLVLTLLASCVTPPPPGNQAYQLRLMTWNVAFLTLDATLPTIPPVELEIDLKGEGFGNLERDERAQRIADGVLRAASDVVAFQEVFSEEARDELVAQLAQHYPHYVSLIGAEPPLEDVTLGFFDAIIDTLPPELFDYAVEPLDSGLMLFSRFPLLDLPPGTRNDALCSDLLCRLEGRSGGSSNIDAKVAFVRYDDAAGLDQLASKGAGLVALDTPGQPTFVAFSHMQADEGDVYATERGRQYTDMKELIEDTLTASELQHAPIYVLGDLNTPGGSVEWSNRYHPADYFEEPFFACGNVRPCSPTQGGRVLIDAWGFETSPTDLGKTSNGGNRLDYVLHSAVDGRLCMQHARIPWEAAESGEIWYSDHKPVLAEMNVVNAWCSANRDAPNPAHGPAEFVFGGTDCDDNDPTNTCDQDRSFGPADGARISAPGNFQWFVIDQPGSYSVNASGAVDFDIYKHDDLSRAILPWKDEEGEWGVPYAMPDPPYYIRVFATTDGLPDPTVGNVSYTISVHQHLCRDPLDACFLEPQEDVDYDWPDQSQGIADVMEIWYRFKTSGVLDGRLMPGADIFFPDVRFLHESVMGACLGDLSLVEYDDASFPSVELSTPEFVGVELDPDDTDWDDDTQTDERWLAPNLSGRTPDEFAEYFVKITRTCEFGLRTTARMETTLTWFKPNKITCQAQFDDSGVGEDDHVRFDFTFDRIGGGPTAPCEGACDFEHAFDEDWPDGWQQPGEAWLGAVGALQGYYVEQFWPNLFEDEGDASEPDARLEVLWVSGGTWGSAGLAPLDATQRDVPIEVGRFTFADADEQDDADYWYEMSFQLNHRGPVYESY